MQIKIDITNLKKQKGNIFKSDDVKAISINEINESLIYQNVLDIKLNEINNNGGTMVRK